MSTHDPAGSEIPASEESTGKSTIAPRPARQLLGPDDLGSLQPLTSVEPSAQTTPLEPSPVVHAAKDVPRRRDQLLWLWPVCAVAVMAATGHFFGAYGALLSAVVVAATLVLLVGEPDMISRRTRMWVGALVAVVIGVVVTGRYAGVGFLAAPPDAVKPLDFRGKVVETDDLRNRDLRDGLFQGAVFDGLDLRGRNLNGAQAQGASFRRVVLDDALLVGADLRGADFTDACLERADLSGARLAGMVAGGADVRAAVVEAERTAEAATWPQPGAAVPPHCG